MKIKAENREVGPRTILTFDGAPALCALVVRESTTAPDRLKATLVAAVDDRHGAPMPFAGGGKGATPEFRLEMN